MPGFSTLSSSKVWTCGEFFCRFPISVTNLTEFYALNLIDNPRDQSLILIDTVCLKCLNRLQLSNCSLAEPIFPYIAILTELGNLKLFDNDLTGTIAKEIRILREMYLLEIYGNDLIGEIPSGFRNLTSLRCFHASNNSLNGKLPSMKTKLQGIYRVSLASSSIFQIYLFTRIISLVHYPMSLASLYDFRSIDVSENGLTYKSPPDICKRGKLVFFLIVQNFLTGEIPKPY